MLYVFSINRIKFMTRTSMTTVKKGQRKYIPNAAGVSPPPAGRQRNSEAEWVLCGPARPAGSPRSVVRSGASTCTSCKASSSCGDKLASYS